MIFPIMVVEVMVEIIPRGPSHIDASVCRTVLLVRYLISDGISTASKSLFFIQDKPSFFVSFDFIPNCCFGKV